jgi:hypothetical protein
MTRRVEDAAIAKNPRHTNSMSYPHIDTVALRFGHADSAGYATSTSISTSQPKINICDASLITTNVVLDYTTF